jgi:hypothetical protein
MQKPISDPRMRHRQQRFWQIIFPIILVSLVLLAGLVYLFLPAAGAGGNLGAQAETATVVLVLPLLFFLLPALVLLIVAIVLLGKLAGWLPKASLQAFTFAEKAQNVIRKGSSVAAAPIFFVRQKQAQMQQLARSLSPNKRLGKES